MFVGNGSSAGVVSYGVRVLSVKGGLKGPAGIGPISDRDAVLRKRWCGHGGRRELL